MFGPILAVALLSAVVSCKQQPKKYTYDKAANQRMVAILDSITKRNNDKNNPYSPEAQIALFDNEMTLVSNSPYRKAVAKYYKANALLKMGEESQAVALFEELLASPDMGKSGVMLDLQKSLALGYLRLGERANCVANHMAQSCVFPIEGSGVHQLQTGSTKAIAMYQNILKQDPSDLESRWLMNIAYMTIGGYPKNVPAAFLIPGLDVDSSGVAIKPFVDIANDLRLDMRNKAGGVIIDDFNNDGYLDIVKTDWGLDGAMHYFKNNANGSFTDVSVESGLSVFKGGLNIIQADYNNDGLMDIFVMRGAWLPGEFGKQPRSLLRNNGDGTFTDVTIEAGLLSFHPTQAGVWKDFNNDGWLDLFIGNETSSPNDIQPCQLYMSNRDGTFTEVAEKAGCNVYGFIKGVSAADYNNDGLQDIVISMVSGNRVLLKNNGEKDGTVHFEDQTHTAGLDDEHHGTFPTWFWDYDNDGWPDIFVCGYQFDKSMAYSVAAEALGLPSTASKMYLYHNNHDGTFTNVSKQVGLDKTVFAMGSNFGDFDNDGYLDMYLGTGNPDYKSLIPNKLYKNMDGKRFVDVTTAARVGNLQKGHAVSFADVDNDGNQDIFIEVGGAFNGDSYFNSFYHNPGQNANHWISLLLEGTKSNRSAIGARVKLTFKENGITRSVYRDVNSGGSFGSSPLRREIGIGKAAMIDEVEIKWPAGGDQVFKNITPNQFLKIREGDDKIEKVNLKTLDFNSQHKDGIYCAPTAVVK